MCGCSKNSNFCVWVAHANCLTLCVPHLSGRGQAEGWSCRGGIFVLEDQHLVKEEQLWYRGMEYKKWLAMGYFVFWSLCSNTELNPGWQELPQKAWFQRICSSLFLTTSCHYYLKKKEKKKKSNKLPSLLFRSG